MDIHKIVLIYFSPTGTSKKAIQALGAGIVESSKNSDLVVEEVDLTYPGSISELNIGVGELAVFSVPVYAGRVAPLAVERFAAIKGAKGPAVIVVTYGNREYEDALVELSDITSQAGFQVLAGCSFIGEHSFSGESTPIAAGRPDAGDDATARNFGEKIFQKLSGLTDPPQTSVLDLPGNRPYKAGMASLPFIPQVDHDSCNQCGLCLTTCPAGAISLSSSLSMDSGLCIFCCACIKNCPEQAVSIEAAPLKEKRQWLFENCTVSKKPEIFI